MLNSNHDYYITIKMLTISKNFATKTRWWAGPIFILNLISIIFGIAYLSYSAYTVAWEVFGIILLITFFGNLLLVYLSDGVINKNIPAGNRLNWACYGFLIIIMLAMVGMLEGNTTSSGTYSNAFGIGNAISIVSYFSIEVMGMIIAVWAIRIHPFRSEWQPTHKLAHQSIPHKRVRIIILILSFILLMVMGYFAIATLAGATIASLTSGTVHITAGLVGVYAAEFGGFWVFIALSATIFFLKASRRFNKRLLGNNHLCFRISYQSNTLYSDGCNGIFLSSIICGSRNERRFYY